MRQFLLLTVAAAAAMFFTLGCETVPESEQAAENLRSEAQTALQQMTSADPSLQNKIDESAGYAIFPSVGKGGLIVGGAYGKGEVYEQGERVGYASLSQASVGFLAGGQEFSELILFQTPTDLQRFKEGKFALGADASAVALKAGAGAATTFKEGYIVFTRPKGGLMFDISVNGQKFNYRPLSMGPATQPAE